MIKREWLLGVGLVSGGMLLGAASPQLLISPAEAQNAETKIGAVGAVNTAATGQVPGNASQTLFVGADVFQNQTVRTDASGLAEIMFADQSTITVGHGSEVVLDNFVYDPKNEVGHIAVGLGQGTMRFIGGRISKTTPVQIKAPTATLTIRGGVGLFSFPTNQPGLVVFVYGIELTATGSDGVTQVIRRPGFAVEIDRDGHVSAPFRIGDEQLAALLSQLDNPNLNQQGSVPIDPLKPVQKFGSQDTFRPTIPSLGNEATNPSILNNTDVTQPAPPPPPPVTTPPVSGGGSGGTT